MNTYIAITTIMKNAVNETTIEPRQDEPHGSLKLSFLEIPFTVEISVLSVTSGVKFPNANCVTSFITLLMD